MPDRRLVAAAAVLLQLCLGIIYTWSVFRAPLEIHYGWSKTTSIAPYRWSILFFTLAMILAGFLQDRLGPRLIGASGGLLLSAGCLLAALYGHTPLGLNLSYGLLAGLGVGFAYVTPIATCVKWFPDRRGLVVGLAVMGFGLGSMIFAPLLESTLGSDPARFSSTIPRTFFLLAALFLLIVPACASRFHLPPKDWKPAHWSPAPGAAPSATSLAPAQMLKSPQFYVLWVVYFLGSAVGLTAIGESAPLVRELAGPAAAISGGLALGIMSLFNGAGRLFWGAASDRTPSKRSILLAMFALSTLTCALLLPAASNFYRVLAGLCLMGFTYGGYLALMPALTADLFGPHRIGANYGLLFTAWGAAGFTVPRAMAALLELRKSQSQLAQGYAEMFYTLAALAAAGLLAALLLRKPTTRPA